MKNWGKGREMRFKESTEEIYGPLLKTDLLYPPYPQRQPSTYGCLTV